MTQRDHRTGLQELKNARRKGRGLYLTIFVFSFFVNLLMLTGPLYMLQIYDRVLGSRSEETLLALSVLVLVLFIAMGLLDYARSRIIARVGARFQATLDKRVFQAAVRRLAIAPDDQAAMIAQRDLEAVQRFLSSPVHLAFFDIPWTPLFLTAIFIFHPVLGWLAIAGGVCLVLLTLMNRNLTKVPLGQANLASVHADRMADNLKGESEAVQALGMAGASFTRWQLARDAALRASVAATDMGGIFTASSKTFRLFLQSAMLGVGAYLVLQGALSAGAMIAGSILLGRALAPIEVLVSQWALVQRSQQGWARLADLLSSQPANVARTALPRPRAVLDIQSLTVVPPGGNQTVLRMVSFTVQAGQAIGIIGPSGSGKSTLARALTGVWRPAGGTIRLDGATLDQYDPDILGRYIGYLPQRITLFDGTIAENIARLSLQADPADIVKAARRAAAHDMILKLPDGYDTRISSLGGRLSGGQIQRIGLARALYGDPVFLVLDEPNSNLDSEGSTALNHAIRAMKKAGNSVLIMAHRPAAIQECDMLLVLENGTRRAFGPRDQVLRDMVKNHSEITQANTQGGAA
ncbi:type I secretion system permease/ATPase [Pseudorhodobacter turbinis]|uniref:Type I secretion system permease/ATPase n=1 Tax=Pseudorhodobacter turbinis TaxID=2500533 RepID=A0A4P8EGE9_9RHOB|nr:type I secretion system permease/ATPase [Pseudorhodobacter turbinis]QCO56230.1 type I secretion system permease/ATPase [Pseudorhodobacter turbinis]